MTFQALAAFLVSWVLPTGSAPSRRVSEEDVPRWERHPVEQRRLRESDRRATDLWSQAPRPW